MALRVSYRRPFPCPLLEDERARSAHADSVAYDPTATSAIRRFLQCKLILLAALKVHGRFGIGEQLIALAARGERVQLLAFVVQGDIGHCVSERKGHKAKEQQQPAVPWEPFGVNVSDAVQIG